VDITPKASHRARVSSLKRCPQDLLTALGSGANAVEDAD
jgi:hypothetical protein